MANFRYNPDNGKLEPARGVGNNITRTTKFLVLREGRLVFEGTQAELEASTDAYISKFRKQSGG